jgi:uncharacterized protein (DUF924 family)
MVASALWYAAAVNSADVLRFWFDEVSPQQWWRRDAQFDSQLAARFRATHDAAARGELFSWRTTPDGRLAEIIVLDQFSRNIYRDTSQAFAFDALALVLAQEAVASGADRELPGERRSFMYMPYMHSESLLIHERAVELFGRLKSPSDLDYEFRHKRIIERFGRYPHRNAVLGRASTPEEIEFVRTNPGF